MNTGDIVPMKSATVCFDNLTFGYKTKDPKSGDRLLFMYLGYRTGSELFNLEQALRGLGWVPASELEDRTRDLSIKLSLSEGQRKDTKRHASRLADALMDINNMIGEDPHVKPVIESIDGVMRGYANTLIDQDCDKPLEVVRKVARKLNW
jgi:hypothetical protein